MINYTNYEKEVYNWLSNKNKQDSNFTFSLRQKGAKGAELDYFIGTEKSRYFATTFWSLPVGFPGSSGDCIGLVFKVSKDYSKFSYDFKFTQTNSPHDAQNTSALNLIKSATQAISESVGAKRISADNNKMFTIRSTPKEKFYTNLETMLVDVAEDLSKLLPIINTKIEEEKKVNPTFEAHRITKEEFAKMQEKLEKRLEKYGSQNILNNESHSIREKFSDWLKGNESSNKINSYLRAVDILNELLQKDIYLEKNIAQLTILYRDLIENQRDRSGKYFYEAAPSYGNSGFYSASIKAFIDFLKESHGIIPKKIERNMAVNKKAINQILYGPPGTGKTYYLKDQLFDKYTSNETSLTKEQYLENKISDLSWWEVVTVALLDLKKAKVPEIRKHKWVQIKEKYSNSSSVNNTLWTQLQTHTVDNCENVKFTNRRTPQIFSKTTDSYWEILENEVEELVPELYDLKDSVDNYNPDPDTVIKHYDFVTFHQSFAYEDFIEGIKPVLPENEEEVADLGYRIEDGVFKRLCDKADKDPNNRYAIFIDEINRGNVSAIFGELITLIEIDKRKGSKNAIPIKLPYSKTMFRVPSNLDIYGTMNTADRSVEALDTALRRRFEFKEMMPKPALLKEITFDVFNLERVLTTINERITVLLDRDYVIGHSYFINLKSEDTLGLAKVFSNNVVPLLQEYFYNDYQKIALVLGVGFVEEEKNKEVPFPDFSEIDKPESLTTYNLKEVDEETIVTAIEQLLLISE